MTDDENIDFNDLPIPGNEQTGRHPPSNADDGLTFDATLDEPANLEAAVTNMDLKVRLLQAVTTYATMNYPSQPVKRLGDIYTEGPFARVFQRLGDTKVVIRFVSRMRLSVKEMTYEIVEG